MLERREWVMRVEVEMIKGRLESGIKKWVKINGLELRLWIVRESSSFFFMWCLVCGFSVRMEVYSNY